MSDMNARQNAPIRRRQLFVDRKLQGTLLAHTTLYWFYCLLSVTVIAIGWILLVRKPATSSELFDQVWMNLGPSVLGAIILLPLVLMDCLRLSNRFAGPMLRIQRATRQMAEGESPATIHLREGDFFCSFANDLNVIIERMESSTPPAMAREELREEFRSTESPTPVATEAVAARPATPSTPNTVSATSIYSDLSL